MVSYKKTKKLYQHADYSGYDYDLYPAVYSIKPGVGNEETHIELGYTRQLGRVSINASLYGDWHTTLQYYVSYDSLFIYDPIYEDGKAVLDKDGNPTFMTTEKSMAMEASNYSESTFGGMLKVATDYRFGNMRGNLLVGCHFENFSINSVVDFNVRNRALSGSYTNESLAGYGKEDNLSLFVQDKHYFTPQLILNAGIRYDQRFREKDQLTTFSPRLALMYVPSDRFSLKFSYSEAFADLAFYYRYVLTNVFKVDPQHLSAFQLTAMGKVAPWKLSYEVSLFYNNYTNLPCWVSRQDDDSFDINASVNNSQLKNVGIEATARYAGQRISGGLNLYYCHNISCKNYYYNSIEKKVTGVPHFTMSLHGAYKLIQTASHEFKVYGHASYIGRRLNQTEVLADDYYLNGQALFDLGVRYSYRQRLNFSLDCENLLNSDRYLCETFTNRHPIFQRGRTLMASVAYTF